VGGNGTSGSAQWQSENRTGTIEGNFLVVQGPEPVEESVDVANGTVAMFLNVSVEGGEVEFRVAAPDCADETCEEVVPMEGGSGSFSADTPMDGTWRVILTPQGSAGPYSAEYALEIATASPSSSGF
jgi:hypothetical protein